MSDHSEVPIYTDSVERSAELLRLAIPIMSRQRAGMHPVSYAVWYEYVSRCNQHLNGEIDALLEKDGHLGEEETLDLYCRYVRTRSEEVAARANNTLQRAIADVSTSARRSEDSANTYSQHLEQFSASLTALAGQAQLPTHVTQMMTHTGEVLLSMSSLLKVLTSTQGELDVLREELHQNREEAITDTLTGLRNRRGFDHALARCIAEQQGDEQAFSLLLIDIDHFKRINDNYGHVVGDKVLRLVAQVLRDNVRGADTVARIGGEEFALLLAHTQLAGAKRVGEIVCNSIGRSQIRASGGDTVDRVTVSVGVGTYRIGESPEHLLQRVDDALYRSKNTGRDRVTLAELPATGTS